MQHYWSFYAGGQTIDGNLACMMADDADLASLPRFISWRQPARSCSPTHLSLAGAAWALGRDDELQIVPGVMHGFLQNTRELAAARRGASCGGKCGKGF